MFARCYFCFFFPYVCAISSNAAAEGLEFGDGARNFKVLATNTIGDRVRFFLVFSSFVHLARPSQSCHCVTRLHGESVISVQFPCFRFTFGYFSKFRFENRRIFASTVLRHLAEMANKRMLYSNNAAYYSGAQNRRIFFFSCATLHLSKVS